MVRGVGSRRGSEVLLLVVALVAGSSWAGPRSASLLQGEAVCDLRALFTSERALLQEKDYYSTDFQALGFEPLPCVDGSRPSVPGPGWISGCHFAYRAELSGSRERPSFSLVARGVSAESQGLEIHMGPEMKLEGVEPPEAAVDCEEVWRRRDPVWRWREVEQDRDCCMRTDLAGDPRCLEAIRVLVDAARAGIGLASAESNRCPAAKELLGREQWSSAQRLCGQTPTPGERESFARKLASEGTLARALATADCSPQAFRVGLPLLERDLARQCQTDECLTALERASQVDPAATFRLASKGARVLSPLLEARVREAREPQALVPLLSALLGPEGKAASLAVLLVGEVSPASPLGLWSPSAPESPLRVPLLELARRRTGTSAASVAEVLLERLGGTRASSQAFEAAMAAVPCSFFSEAGDVSVVEPGRLAAVAARADGCREVGAHFQAQLARMEPRRLVQELSSTSCHALEDVGPWLGWGDAGRAELLFPWLARRCPRVADLLLAPSAMSPWADVRLEPHLVRLAFVPETIEALGGKDMALWVLFSRREDVVSADVARELAKVVTREPYTPRWFAKVWALPLSHAELRALFQGPLQSSSASIRAAVAGAMASAGSSDIPPEAARACGAEIREFVACRAAGKDFAGPMPQPLHTAPGGQQWCLRYFEKERDCPTEVCGRFWQLGAQEQTVLKAATGEDLQGVVDLGKLERNCAMLLMAR